MSHHHLVLPQPTSVAPNPSFFAWLRHHALLFIGQIVGLVSGVASFVYYVKHAFFEGAFEKTRLEGTLENTELEHLKYLKHLNDHLQLWSDCAHLLFIFLFICVLIYVLDSNDRGRYHA